MSAVVLHVVCRVLALPGSSCKTWRTVLVMYALFGVGCVIFGHKHTHTHNHTHTNEARRTGVTNRALHWLPTNLVRP